MRDNDNIDIEETQKDDVRLRVNITMSRELVDFYQQMAESMGIARSTCMVIALKTYMDQQNMLKLTNQLPKL